MQPLNSAPSPCDFEWDANRPERPNGSLNRQNLGVTDTDSRASRSFCCSSYWYMFPSLAFL
jgi:hypothetical protein